MGGLLVLILYLLGIAWIIEGSLMVVVPDMMRENFFSRIAKFPIKKIGIIPIVIGTLLLLASTESSNPFLIVLLGLLGIAKGVLCIVSTAKASKIMDNFLKADNRVHRAIGVLAILLGSLVLIGI